MKKRYIGLLMGILLIFVSCSHHSKNIIKKGSFDLRGGVSEAAEWSDYLSFDRISWYNEITLQMDLLVADLSMSSPFRNWLSPSERDLFNKCDHPIIVLFYGLDSKIVTQTELRTQLESQGGQEIMIPKFEKNIRAHPDFYPKGFHQHKVLGYCKNGPTKSLEFSLPGYPAQKL